MVEVDFFATHGFFVKRGFLEKDYCDRILLEMRESHSDLASVIHRGRPRVDQDVRRANVVTVRREFLQAVTESFATLAAALEKRFQIPLGDFERPQFLVYAEGDHFRPHRDVSTDALNPANIRARSVSVVVFLNDQAKKGSASEYSGGDSVFYGLIEPLTWQNCRHTLAGEAGLLIAFPSNVLHEVSPVAQGSRYTVVTFFHRAPAHGPGHRPKQLSSTHETS